MSDASGPGWLRDDRLVAVAWSRVAEPGDRAATAVRELLGPEAALRAVLQGRSLPAAVREASQRWRVRARDVDPEADVAAVHRVGGRVVVPADREWPTGLDDLGEAAPPCLWVRGPAQLAHLAERSVAVVGSRASTTYGEHVAGAISAGAAGAGWTVVSGAALGIDAVAHRAALVAGGPTVAVLACGVDRVYPAAHAGLLRRVAESGLVVSESPPGGAPTRWRFLERNRLIAAMAGATVVVEAAWRSGALSTATRAAGLGRPVGAVPGPVTSASSAGCHRLLRELAAVCVTDAEEVLELAAPIGTVTPRGPELVERPHDDLDGFDLRVWESVPLGAPATTTSVAEVAGLPERQVVGALGRLELRGLVEAVPGADGSGWRRRRRAPPEVLAAHPPDRV